jgi:predicted RecA/RadA family phage recombinase
MATVFVEMEKDGRIRFVNTTGAAIALNEFVIIGNYTGVATEDIPVGARGTIHVEDSIKIQIGAADIDTGASFTAANVPCFYNPTTKKFTDQSASGLYAVGQVAEPKNSRGVVRIFKFLRFTPVAP